MSPLLKYALRVIMLAAILVQSSILNAQLLATYTSASGAKIGKGISIEETSSLHFGTMTRPTGAVNVIVSTTNVRTASALSNISLLAQAPVHHNAAYNVFGDKNKHYVITLPANNTITISNGVNSMTINDFTPNSNSNGQGSFSGKLSQQGDDSFTVGATLVLSSNQPAGLYTGTFAVTVNYP